MRKIIEFTSVIDEALEGLAPGKICTYLFELTQEFNRFYESNQVIGSADEPQNLAILRVYRDTLAHGLKLLGIKAPERV